MFLQGSNIINSISCLLLCFTSTTIAAPAGDMSSAPAVKRDFKDNADCVWAGKYMPFTYMDCFTDWQKGASYLTYTIRLTGNGMVPDNWMKGIYDNIIGDCQKPDVNPLSSNNDNSPYTVAYTLDGDKGWQQTKLQGVDMQFTLNWPWNEGDANHECIAHAVLHATCPQVEIANGAHCVNLGWNSTEVTEYWTGVGPA